MKKLYISFLLCLSVVSSSLACGGSDYDYDNYYNLFMQAFIDDSQPYLLTWENISYSTKAVKNENAEQWQAYLGLSYEDTEYLVFGAPKASIDSLIKKQTVADKRLSFATASWTKKYHQALLYLSYAKYLEPYMRIVPDTTEWNPYDYSHVEGCGYYESFEHGNYYKNAGDLDYDKVINVLQRSWNAEKDNELKLRYGYQMVRLAHYTRRYAEAVEFFERYVESLNYRPAMYYYALNQRAGAESGLGNRDEANYLFFKVFSNTKNLKKNTLRSMSFLHDDDYQRFLERAKSANEINDAYLLMGYLSFSNPLAMAEEVVKNSPDAIQAKLLMAWAVGEIEYNHNSTSSDNKMLYEENYDKSISISKNDDFLLKALDFSLKMTQNKKVKEKDFWNLTTAYLYFLNKDFDVAKKHLAKVSNKEELFKSQKERFAAYIYLCEQPKITPEVEKVLFEKYQELISIGNHGASFLTDVLANRYYLQEDYAKSFLISNHISVLEAEIDLDLLDKIETFILKSNKNEWEKRIAPSDNMIEYINYLRGDFYLANGDLEEALAAFSKISPYYYQKLTDISLEIFGYNQIECFRCPPEQVMKNDFSAQFSFIKKTMNKKELVEALIQLQEIGEQDNEKGTKANYLLGNFFYNVSITGYYRHILFYGNQTDIAADYLEKSYEQANDKELKARIAFALSKCEQARWDIKSSSSGDWFRGDDILISDRKYFAELAQYKGTRFYEEVKTHCKYFEYYVNNVVK